MRRKAHFVRFPLLWGAGCLLGLVLSGAGAAQAKAPPGGDRLIDFEVTVRQVDPFSDANQVGAPVKPVPVGARNGPFRRGTTFTLTITGKPKPGYHTYPITQRAAGDTQTEGSLTRLEYQLSAGLKPLWPITETPAPEFEREPDVGVYLVYEHAFQWSQDILVQPDATPGTHTLDFTLRGQVCKDSCADFTRTFKVVIEVSADKPLPLSSTLAERLKAKPQVTVLPVPLHVKTRGEEANAEPKKGDAGGNPDENPAAGGAGRAWVQSPNQKADSGWLALLLTSILSGAGMLLTPCVFPMIPITVSFFLKQSEKEHHKPLIAAGLYSGTIIVVLAGSVTLLAKYIGDVADSPWTNLGLGLVLVFFALSLFGMYEIELPHFLSRFTSSREGQGGYAGVVFMALTFTITSFTCTGPFLGPLLATTASARFTFAQLAVASTVYAATFAAPFFFLALFPSLIKKLPKSGGWLNSVKVVMGFVEIAAALKFLSNVDVAWHPGNPWFFTYETVLIAWIVLSVACGLYLLGLYRLPHDTPVEHIGVSRMLLATFFLGLALYMTPALARKIPQGVLGEQIVNQLPLDTSNEAAASGPSGQTAASSSAGEGQHLTWYRDYEAAWKAANKEGKDLFIDFTGINCLNCRANENTVFPRPQVQSRLKKYVRVQLYTDSVPDPNLSADQATALGKRNLELQDNTFGDKTRPLYVILRPAKDRPIENGKLKGEILNQLGGKNDVNTFVQFFDSAAPHREVAQRND